MTTKRVATRNIDAKKLLEVYICATMYACVVILVTLSLHSDREGWLTAFYDTSGRNRMVDVLYRYVSQVRIYYINLKVLIY